MSHQFPAYSLDKVDDAKEDKIRSMLEEQARRLQKMQGGKEENATVNLPDAQSLKEAEERFRQFNQFQQEQQRKEKPKPNKPCRFCGSREFPKIAVHERRCKENPDRLPWYGGKPALPGTGPGPKTARALPPSTGLHSKGDLKPCPFCKQKFYAKGLHFHKATCAKNPAQFNPRKPEIMAETRKPAMPGPTQFTVNSAATADFIVTQMNQTTELKRVVMINMGNGVRHSFLVVGDKLEPVEIRVVDMEGKPWGLG
jgi:hypothetical protein